jgi:hypothetical protein
MGFIYQYTKQINFYIELAKENNHSINAEMFAYYIINSDKTTSLKLKDNMKSVIDDYESRDFHIIEYIDITGNYCLRDIIIDNDEYYISISPVICFAIDKKVDEPLHYFIDITEFLNHKENHDKDIINSNRTTIENYRNFIKKHRNRFSYIFRYSITKRTVLYDQVKQGIKKGYEIDESFDSFGELIKEMANDCLLKVENGDFKFKNNIRIYSCSICISLRGEMYSISLVDQPDIMDIINKEYKIINVFETVINKVSIFNRNIITIGEYTFNVRPVAIYAVKNPGYYFGFMHTQFEFNNNSTTKKRIDQFLEFIDNHKYKVIIYEYTIIKNVVISDDEIINLFNGSVPIATQNKKPKKKKNKKGKAKTYIIEELDEHDNVINSTENTEEVAVEETTTEESSDDEEPEIKAIVKYEKPTFINTNRSLIIYNHVLLYYFNYLSPDDEQRMIKRKFDYLYKTNNNFKSRVAYYDKIVILKGIHLDFTNKTNSLHITFRLYGKCDASNVLHAYLNSAGNIVSITEVIDWLN